MRKPILCLLAALAPLALYGCAVSQVERARLKSELKMEIIAELNRERARPAPAAAAQGELARMRHEIEKNLLARIESRYPAAPGPARPHPQGVRRTPTPVGNVEGKILRRGKALAGCRVKAVLAIRSFYMRDIFRTMQEGTEFIAVTNEAGSYRFRDIPIGDYKLKWQPPGEDGWIRRLRDKPDVAIEAGRTALAAPIEVHRRLVPH